MAASATSMSLPAYESWAAEQLTAFLGSVSRFDEERKVIQAAVERIAEAFETEVTAIVAGNRLEASFGFPAGSSAESAILEILDGECHAVDLPGLGSLPVLEVEIDDERLSRLILATSATESFGAEEMGLMRAMLRVLTMTLRMVRTLDSERELRERSERQGEENVRLLNTLREREQLLERLSRIQRSIVSRTALDEVLDSIVDGAAELLGDEVVGLRLIDPNDASRTVMVATRGISSELLEQTRLGRLGEGAGGRSISEARLIVTESYEGSPAAHPSFAEKGIQAAMAAPVRELGRVVGSLVVATRAPGRRYSHAEREVLLAFAEHASLALSDAKTVNDAIHQAVHDSLTGLPNRTLLLDRLEQALARSRRTQARTAVMFIDLDRFKTVNDSLGHAAGDELLIAVATRLSEVVRPGDTVARFGGDEFVLLLEDFEDSELSHAADRILEALRQPFRIRERDVVISASIGIAAGNQAPEDLLRNADLALYRAKSAGKGRYDVFEQRMHTAMVQRLERESELRLALRRDELVLFYQPIFDLRRGTVAGMEALARWRHPERGLLAPSEFIPVAEDSGLIIEIGRKVIAEATRQAARWREQVAGMRGISMGVNVSSMELAEPDLVGYIEEACEKSAIDPAILVIEMTETALVRDAALAAQRLRELKALGARVAVDDFGTGYASLQHLQTYPIDAIKMPKSFVDGVTGTAEQSALARAIVDLGESFDLVVVAEGIETPEQRRRLVELDAKWGQGYLFARPGRPEQLDAVIRNGVGPLADPPAASSPLAGRRPSSGSGPERHAGMRRPAAPAANGSSAAQPQAPSR